MDRSQAEDILRDLVRIPSVTDDRQANNHALIYISEFLDQRGMHIEHREYEGTRALVATTAPTMTPEVMLVAHVDVVPAARDLFEVREADGRLFGRGVFDMKSAIAAFLALTDDLKFDLSRYDYGIKIVTDEEKGGHGVRNLLGEGFAPRVAILPDGGSDWRIETQAKGAWTVRVRAHGEACHGSRPWEGESASFKLLDALHEVRGLFEGQNLMTDTLNVTLLSGGVAQNQVPAVAEAVLDIRVVDQPSYLKTKAEVTEICRRRGLECEVLAFLAPYAHDVASPYITQFRQSIKTVLGADAGEIMSAGACDAVYYALRGIPCVVTRPAGGGAHGKDEWLDKNALDQMTRILKHYLQQVNLRRTESTLRTG